MHSEIVEPDAREMKLANHNRDFFSASCNTSRFVVDWIKENQCSVVKGLSVHGIARYTPGTTLRTKFTTNPAASKAEEFDMRATTRENDKMHWNHMVEHGETKMACASTTVDHLVVHHPRITPNMLVQVCSRTAKTPPAAWRTPIQR